MPKFLIDKLKAEYPNNPHAVYGTLNNLGAMHGNKETAKGAAMQAKHDAKVAAPRRVLHPALAQRSAMVKQAHAHLSQHVPGFSKLPMRQQMLAHQRHVNLQLGKKSR